ncbi:translation initiation factor IF-2-like [Balaenoptera musculus]|uniref:Translation initiation factor IF-2-like n=1 Tax=Balaenoptera musculus TaxID=9771 RepID=A0A8B8WBL8_BALMU|nr:translation initiation factor IF-2-like [Balaenoptera musculus]
MQDTLAFEARLSRGVPWAAATETGAPDTYKSSPLGDAGALDHSRGTACGQRLPSDVSGEAYGQLSVRPHESPWKRELQTCLAKPWLEETLDTDQGQRVLRSGVHSTPRRPSALSPAGPPAGKRARRAEAASPAAHTGPHSVVRSRPRCRSAASPSHHGPSAASGTLAVDTMPTPAWGPRLASRPLGRPPPGGCGPAACAGPASQPEDAGPRAPVRQAPPCSAHFGAGLIALRAGGLPFQPGGGPMGAGLEDVSALAVRPHAAPPPMGTRPEEQGGRKGPQSCWTRAYPFDLI